MKPKKTGRIGGVSFDQFQSARSQAEKDRREAERQQAEDSRRQFEPDPQRIVSQVMAEIPPTTEVGFDPRVYLAKYARIIAVECMRRMKEKSTV